MQIDKWPFHSKDEWQGCLNPDECWWFAGDVRAQQTGRPTKRGGENIEQSLKLKRVCWFEEKTFAHPLKKNEKYISHDVLLQVSKEFMMSPNKLHLECSLDKELYYHGETISVNVHIQVRHVHVGILHFLLNLFMAHR